MKGVSRELERQYATITWRIVHDLVGRHPQFEDIVGQANFEVWRRVARFPEGERDRHHRLVRVIARQAVCHFLRGPENETRTHTPDGHALPARCSLETIAWRAKTADFAPRLVERLWRQWLWEESQRAADPQTRLLLRLHYREGWSHERLGQEFGHAPVWSFYRIRTVLQRLQRRFKEESSRA